MDDTSSNYIDKVQRVVKNTIKIEETKFRGKTITREVVKKEWNIPKIINTDIGFQLMFGFKAPVNTNKQKGHVQTVSMDYL